MARNRRGKMALYEVMSKAKNKPGYKRTLENIRTGKPGEEEPTKEKEEALAAETAVEDAPEVSDDRTDGAIEQEAVDDGFLAVQWRRKPRVVQYNNGRVEFSVPYQLGIAAVLGLIVVMLLAFRAGQRSVVGSGEIGAGVPAVKSGGGVREPAITGNEGAVTQAKGAKETGKDAGNTSAVTSTGSNVIILAQYRASRDLVPVQAHFASYGIATEIVSSGGLYFLVTQATYSGPSLVAGSGGAGDLAIKKIVEVGAKYKGKAPEGYETFAPHYFDDAYGKLKWY